MPLDRIFVVTVTYFPDLHQLQRQLLALPDDLPKILVDNTAIEETRAALEQLSKSLPHVHLLCNPHNLGLAAAINRGIEHGVNLDPAAQFVFLLDQDSIPESNCLSTLMQTFKELQAQGFKVGAVGPYLLDEKTGAFHGFHQMRGWRWQRAFPKLNAAPVDCANLNGSGTLMPVNLLLSLGGLDETFFIDHVDTEWSFRLLSHGYSLWGVPKALLRHNMGKDSLRIWWFGRRIWPLRTPMRHRYLFRNAIRLMKRSYVPTTWKIWAAAKLALTLVVHALFDSQRHTQVQAMLLGLWEGLKDDAFPHRPHP
ncbi:MAG: glycosyltransferase family 2 protein [Methylohalobius sp.]|nr:glycosyltransferase family 2 protein [Methylohalobius sp.]